MASIKVWEASNFSQEVKSALSQHKQVSRKQLLWIELYFGAAQMNATEAARLAKYKFPAVDGPRLKRQFEGVLSIIFNEQSALRRAEAEEVIEGISDIARQGQSESNRLKAWELLAKIHGLFNDKLSISVDRRTLVKQIEDIIQANRQALPPKLLAKPIEIEAKADEDDKGPNDV